MLKRTLVALFVATWLPKGAADFEYERVVPECASRGETGSCHGARRHELGLEEQEVLALLETDAECVLEALKYVGEPAQLHGKSIAAPTSVATCGVLGIFSLEVFSIGAGLKAACGGEASNHWECEPLRALAALRAASALFRANAAAATQGLEAPAELAATLRHFVTEEVEVATSAVNKLWSTEAQRRWTAAPATLPGAILEVCEKLGLGRRALFWRSNMLLSVADFGLTRYLPLVAPRRDFFHSRFDVLTELLGGPPAQGTRLVEVGVHLARIAFALLSHLQGLNYIGVDPFLYDPELTSPESVARQLSDLGLDPEDGLGAERLSGEVRKAAEAKIQYFGDRAQLLPMPSVEAAASLPDSSVDVVFIDGDHSYAQVVRDINAWEPKVKPGGFLCGHDFGNHPDVARAVLEHAASRNKTVRLAMDWVWYWHV